MRFQIAPVFGVCAALLFAAPARADEVVVTDNEIAEAITACRVLDTPANQNKVGEALAQAKTLFAFTGEVQPNLKSGPKDDLASFERIVFSPKDGSAEVVTTWPTRALLDQRVKSIAQTMGAGQNLADCLQAHHEKQEIEMARDAMDQGRKILEAQAKNGSSKRPLNLKVCDRTNDGSCYGL